MFKFLKSFFPIFLLAAFLLIGGLGCKGASKEEQAATRPVTLEYWTVFDDFDAMQSLITKYKADRPYLTINLRQLRAEELYPRLVEALAEDRGPDIISIRNRWINGLKTKLAPMPPVVNDTTVRIEKGAISTQTIIQTTAKVLPTSSQLANEYVQTVKADVEQDGKVYGLPLSLDLLALYYNKDILDRAGIPEPPKTWEEFQAAVKKLTKYDKKTSTFTKILQAGAALGTGNNIPGSDDLLYILFKQSGMNFISKEGRVVLNLLPPGAERGVDTPAMSVVNFFTDFANSNRDTYSWNESMDNALDAFANGSLAFFFGYSYHYPLIKARAPQLNIGILPMLQLNPENPINAANYWAQAVVGKSKHPNEAWALVNYLTHSTATKEYLDSTGRPTALRAYISAQLEKPELAPFASQVLIADNWYRGKNYEAAAKAINDLLHEWLLPPPDPDKILEFRQDILNRAAAKVEQTL